MHVLFNITFYFIFELYSIPLFLYHQYYNCMIDQMNYHHLVLMYHQHSILLFLLNMFVLYLHTYHLGFYRMCLFHLFQNNHCIHYIRFLTQNHFLIQNLLNLYNMYMQFLCYHRYWLFLFIFIKLESFKLQLQLIIFFQNYIQKNQQTLVEMANLLYFKLLSFSHLQVHNESFYLFHLNSIK